MSAYVMDIRVPELGATAQQANVLRWFVRVGDHVQKAQVLAELEADKTNVELEAPASGVLTEILAPPGSVVEVDAVVARLTPAAGQAAVSGGEVRRTSGGEPKIRLPNTPSRSSGADAHAQRRCKFCNALEMSGRIDCARCGAPL